MEKSCKKCALEASQDPSVYNPKQALHASNYIIFLTGICLPQGLLWTNID